MRRTALGIVVAGLALAGCGGSGTSTASSSSATSSPSASASASPSASASLSASASPSASPSPEPSDSPSPEPSASPSPAPPGGGSTAAGGTVPALGTTGTYTAPATKLKIGEKALVPFALSKKGGTLGVTVTGVKTGTAAELAQLELGDRVAGMTPYYVMFTVTNESGGEFAFSSLGLAGGVYGDGTDAQRVGIIGDFAPCPNTSAGKAFGMKGASYTTCVVSLAAGTAKVTGGHYQGSSYEDFVPNAPEYGLKPLVWQP